MSPSFILPWGKYPGTNPGTVALITAILLLVPGSDASAGGYRSENYHLEATVVAAGSGESTSEHWTSTVTIGQPTPGSRASSPGYNADFGYGDATTVPLNISALAQNYYGTVLDRGPDEHGLAFWHSEIERADQIGVNVSEGFVALAKVFFESEEYYLKSKTDAQYVTDLYETFLGRLPEPAGLQYWLDYLHQGLTWGMLFNNFAYSSEFPLHMENFFGPNGTRPEYRLVNDLYRGLMGRLPDNVGFAHWVGEMQTAQCVGDQAVRDMSRVVASLFVQSPEYGLRNRTDAEYVEDLYNGFLRRGADAGGYLHWVNLLTTQAFSRESVLNLFVESPEFQYRVQEVINEGCRF